MGKLWNKETLEPTTQSPYNSGLERVAKGARRNGTRWRSGPTNATASQRSSSVIQLSHLLSWASLKASDIAILSKLKKIWWVQRYFLCEYNVKHLCQVLCQVFCWNVENLLACKLHVVLSFHSFLLSRQCGLFRLDECCCLSIKQQSSPTWAENSHNDDSTRKSLAAEARRCCNWKMSMSKGLEDYMIQWCIILSQLQSTTSWYWLLPVQSGLLSQRAREDVTDLGRFWLP